MAAAVKLAFERQLIVARLDEILPTRQLTDRIKKMVKYRRIERKRSPDPTFARLS